MVLGGAAAVFRLMYVTFRPQCENHVKHNVFSKVLQGAGCILEAHWGLLDTLLVFLGTQLGYSRSTLGALMATLGGVWVTVDAFGVQNANMV